LSLDLHADGRAVFDVVGASPFPRHWIYGPDGELAAKSGLIDFQEWTRVHDHQHTPWHDFERPVLMSQVESQVERELSLKVMKAKHEMVRLDDGSALTQQGQPGGAIYLILDGMLRVIVDGEEVAELGPGAIVGERAVLEGGMATATVIARTQVRAARIPADLIEQPALAQVAATHRRESV
jgi:CRP-like cAMP-binding protein